MSNFVRLAPLISSVFTKVENQIERHLFALTDDLAFLLQPSLVDSVKMLKKSEFK